ncbi:hypothetical protein FRAAL1338 [Frankia alni ACN14a]|uniref:Uncharacterized protein n=1 Tax=Frankia alni (strain DSM 45986 / CECT 9034 / ACN14a) TaxID=326424 RepID=Q0RR25_FRAAA|nr:hypothetical protein FRAAL1338 [Frankia alni ACN14a]
MTDLAFATIQPFAKIPLFAPIAPSPSDRRERGTHGLGTGRRRAGGRRAHGRRCRRVGPAA